MHPPIPLRLEFFDGCLLASWAAHTPDAGALAVFANVVGCGGVYDERVRKIRYPAALYRDLTLKLKQLGVPVDDQARRYPLLRLHGPSDLTPRPHQKAALQAWEQQGGHGIVVLPTGAGKTILAVLAISRTRRATLVVVPTLDLLGQWVEVLTQHLGVEIGTLGGGEHNPQPLTVATYDSAARHVDHLGARFGLLICDECHHLPGPVYQRIARNCVAPFRLGLTATLERQDQGEAAAIDLLGPVVYQARIREMTQQVLSPYDVETIYVRLSSAERFQYESARRRYLTFVRRHRLRLAEPGEWNRFLLLSSQSVEGREAFESYRTQKRLAQAAVGKEAAVWEILQRHGSEAVLIFTEDNEMAYNLAKKMILPVITYRTRTKERSELLRLFRDGKLKVIVTSKVLNEGVDVPAASVGVIVSGNASVREHVQRLGRILRHAPGKRAILYEIVSRDTAEQDTNQRRKQHDAYQTTADLQA